MPSLVLKSNLARRCCLMVALISARFTSKFIQITTNGQVNDIIQMCNGSELMNSYDSFVELRFTSSTS